MRVLFVDDDPDVLGGLRRMLRPRARDWEMLFADGGQAALDLVSQQSVDVVVTDMRMPDMDGATLLARLRADHPETVRIVLSGHSALASSLRSAQVAHQFLTKPCDPEHLKEAVHRACALRDRLGSPALRRIVGDLAVLPSPPQVVVELNRLLASEDASLDAVADVVATDPALAAKLLQLVNSAFFGLGQRLSSVRSAVGYLGLNVLRNLTVATSAFDTFSAADLGAQFVAEEQAHALEVSALATELVPKTPEVHDAFVAGLLHDVGNLILAQALPDELRASRQLAVEAGITAAEAERVTIGTTHAELGAYLLSLWGLPSVILEAVASHHDAPSLPHRSLDVVHATYLANALVAGRRAVHRRGGGVAATLDPTYVAELGLTEVVAGICRP